MVGYRRVCWDDLAVRAIGPDMPEFAADLRAIAPAGAVVERVAVQDEIGWVLVGLALVYPFSQDQRSHSG